MSNNNSPEKLFTQWFAEQYECGLPNQHMFSVCEAYLQGLLDACGIDSNRSNLIQCISTLRSAGVMVRVLNQYQVKINE